MKFTYNDATAAGTNDSKENWKAQGFLNLYLPGMNGQRKKLGAIPLREFKPNEKKLLAWLNEDPSRVAHLLAKLEIEYQTSQPGDAAGFDLGA